MALQPGAVRIARATEYCHSPPRPLQVRPHTLLAEIRIHRHDVGVVALERLLRIPLCGAADVATFGVEDDRNVRVAVVNVPNQIGQVLLAPSKWKDLI
jgi:hypothetical protein